MDNKDRIHKLAKARRISDLLLKEILSCIRNKKFPAYYNSYVNRRLQIDIFIIDLKYSN